MRVNQIVVSGICLLAVLISIRPAWAADPPKFGVEGGVNLTTLSLSGNDVAGFEAGMKAGLAVGAAVSLPLTPMFSIQPEVLYSQKHSKLNGSGSSNGFTSTFALDEIEIAGLAKFDLSPMKMPDFYVVAGPALGFITSAKQKDQVFPGVASIPDTDLKATDKVQSTDFSIIGGAGVAKGKWAIEARYEVAISNIAKNTGTGDSNAKPRTITALFRWWIN